MTDLDLDLLVELVPGAEPQVVAAGGRPRDFRRVSSVLRGQEKALVERLIREVEADGRPAVRTADTGVTYLAAPVSGPDHGVPAVQIVAGTDLADTTRAAPCAVGHWEMFPDSAPRLHVTPEFLDLAGVPAVERDRAVYGPLDFFQRVARIADLVRLWEDLLTAGPGYRSSGSVIVRRTDGAVGVLLYAQRYLRTDSGPRVRVILQDATATADRADLGFELLDATVSMAITETAEMFGAVVESRWPAPCVLQWLTGYPKWAGHGVSTGQTPGLHPDDIARIPGLLTELAAHGIVRSTMRTRSRSLTGGWVHSRFAGRMIDPAVSGTLGLVLVHPEPIGIEDEAGNVLVEGG
ncbi:GAF domain-containing protein [Nocardia sp. CA-290969]|uniref:GAF domain-containing protein n=1 Tax=Nocardia sp. CA-290969 TaxID=3239986 RepID=UPI003D8DDAE0